MSAIQEGNIVDLAANKGGDSVRQQPQHQLAIFGNELTTDLEGISPYRLLAKILGRETVPTLPDAVRTAMVDLITDLKVKGPDAVASIEGFQRLLDDLSARGIRTVVLACTELPLMVGKAGEARGIQVPPGMTFVDPTVVLAEALVASRARSPMAFRGQF